MLLPPLVAIVLVTVTKKVLASLGAEILVAGWLLVGFKPVDHDFDRGRGSSATRLGSRRSAGAAAFTEMGFSAHQDTSRCQSLHRFAGHDHLH